METSGSTGSGNDAGAIVALAKKHGLHVMQEPIEITELGLDFRIAFARTEDGSRWVLRMPRRPDVLARAEDERRILALVREHLPVSVPDWQINTPELIAYPRLAGTAGVTVEPGTMALTWHLDRQSALFVASLAEALVALHGIAADDAARAGVTVLQPDEVRRTVAEEMELVKREFGVAEALWQRWQRWLGDDGYWPPQSVLVHGDLYVGHMLVDEASRVTGILDWTEARVADPAIDFMGHLHVFGEEGLDRLLAAYERAGGRVWPRMRAHVAERLAAAPVPYALFALRSGLDEHVEAVRVQLGVRDPTG